ncbi:hypothetical protein M3D57_10780 [Corynebacterium sanguinis]|uniref:hypothetical protein n=1 Tax=Corynebacterium TaxID=1716 RepID=UPI0011A17602|nr:MULTISPECIES: hypothetical protein [Corynebacterium]MCT1414265.1 hypothetical protein [Corynebacterium sanguinis]MCT1463278.1 hypothetical protein [Corynebacterium sanguinis]MCT1585260.1 hypothetical protein [Corynebacterium sanguinis]MCT2023834.1 hypothetical protein [Corynebacterium sanguinis]MCT2047970.1 hypothetical protein [Corynebacterium sanguinis]
MNDDYESFVPTQADIRPENASWFLDEGDDGAYLTIEVECESLEDKDNEALLDDYVHVAVEWFPLPGNNVDAVVGKRLQSNIFGEPAEPTLSIDGAHWRYDHATVEILKHNGDDLTVRMEFSGDIDGTGLDSFTCEVTATR